VIQLKYFEHFDGILPSGFLESDFLKTILEMANFKLGELGLVATGFDEDPTEQYEELIEVNLMSDAEIQAVNASLRGVDKPTDVISLRLDEESLGCSKEGHSEDMRRPEITGKWATESERKVHASACVFGEIYISLERCAEQAAELEQTFEEEFVFLLIHGVLHIFGYDHQSPEEEEKMMSLAYEILGRK
jgi:probable rRNA maturation factor